MTCLPSFDLWNLYKSILGRHEVTLKPEFFYLVALAKGLGGSM